MGTKCKILFSGPPKGTSLRETASFDVLIVKIVKIVKFCIGVGVHDVIIHANFGDDRFRCF